MKFVMGASIPFGMAFGSFCMLLIIAMGGIAGDFMGPVWKINLKELNIPYSDFNTLTNINLTDISDVTRVNLGLSQKYSFYLWNYASNDNGDNDFSSSKFDYVDKIKLINITVDGVSSPLPKSLEDAKSGFRDKIRYGQMIFMAAIFNVVIVIAFGILACFGIKFTIMVLLGFSVLTTIMLLVFAVLITMAGLNTVSDLKAYKEFGANIDTRTSDLAIVWLAVVHMVAICVMFALMAFGVTKMNPAIKQAPDGIIYDEEVQPSESSHSLINLRSK